MSNRDETLSNRDSSGLRARLGSLVLRAQRVPGLPLVSLRSWLLGGSRFESVPGLSLVTGRMLSEGTHGRDWSRWALDAEDRGMTLQSAGGSETLGVALDALAEDASLAVDWIAELLLEPAFAEERLQWVRRQAAAELEGMLDQPDLQTGRFYLEQLYHPHPYSRPLQGDRDSLETLTPEACAAFHRQALGWGGCLVVVGDIDEEETLERLQRRLAAVAKIPVTPFPEVPSMIGSGVARREVKVGGRDQAHLFIGHTTVPRAHEDCIALELAAVILGAGPGMAGRLPYRIREKEGLAYAVDVSLAASAGLEPGRMTVYLATAPGRLEQAEKAVREELQRVLDEGLTDEEFEDARSFLIGREPFRRETLRHRADRLAETELYGLPADQPGWIEERLQQLDRGQVEAALRRWVRPSDLVVTLGLPKDSPSQ